MRGSDEGRAHTVAAMSGQGRTHGVPVTYIDADGRPIEAPRGLDAGRDDAGERPAMFVHMSCRVSSVELGSSSVRALEPVWRTALVWAAVAFVAGALMVALSSGLAAVVLWPLGGFTMIVAASALWGAWTARRLARRTLTSSPARGSSVNRPAPGDRRG